MRAFRSIKDPDTRRIVAQAVRLGCTVETGKKHGKLHIPGASRVVVFGYTPSCYHAAANFKSQILRVARQAGIDMTGLA
jgi:hypothetical protein